MTLTELRYVVAVADRAPFRPRGRALLREPAEPVGGGEEPRGRARRADLRARQGRGARHADRRGGRGAGAARAGRGGAREDGRARRARNPLEGPLRLGIIHTVAPYLLPELVAALAAVGAADAARHRGEPDGESRRDAARRARSTPRSSRCRTRRPASTVTPLYSENFRVIVPAKHRWARRRTIAARRARRGEPAAAQRRPLLPRPGARRLPRVHAAAGAGQGGQFAGDDPQHGRVGHGDLGAAGDGAHAEVRDAARQGDRFRAAGAVAPHRAREPRRRFRAAAALAALAAAIPRLALPIEPA